MIKVNVMICSGRLIRFMNIIKEEITGTYINEKSIAIIELRDEEYKEVYEILEKKGFKKELRKSYVINEGVPSTVLTCIMYYGVDKETIEEIMKYGVPLG